MADDEKNQWYYNTVKQRAEYGKISPIEQRMGPYKTKEDAEHAWDPAGPDRKGGGEKPPLG